MKENPCQRKSLKRSLLAFWPFYLIVFICIGGSLLFSLLNFANEQYAAQQNIYSSFVVLPFLPEWLLQTFLPHLFIVLGAIGLVYWVIRSE